MARKKGSPKTGGRKKGTPNKATMFGTQTIMDLLDDYQQSGLMAQDFKAIGPLGRLTLMKDLAGYIIPKKKALEADVNVNSEAQQSIIDLLRDLALDNE